ncbi:MAG: hypothetical protein CVT88_05620 [Candidatus Altiarchaeales archaeon HGW-Altiarchaeales-1]|nr:MAG: hypothetical protein CVT88_05620 [Candidatus Altiarchaeales archaeon HGW-Altiarchaeales-1]
MELQKNNKKGIFVSYSFSEEDEKIIKWFVDELKKYFECEDAESPEANSLIKKIIPKISANSIFCAILTKKYETDKGCISSPWIYSEIGSAVALDKDYLIFVENNIMDFGMTPRDYNYVPFDRSKIIGKDKDGGYLKKLRNSIKEYAESIYKKPIFQGYHKIINNISKLTIYNNGHAIEEITVTIKTLSDKFKCRKQGFWLEKCSFKDTNLKPLKSLNYTDAVDKKRFFDETFYARVLSPDNIFVDKVEVINDETTDDKINFFICFKSREGNIPEGTTIKYGWEWSSDNVFPFKKEQLKNGTLKENVDCATYTWETLNDYDNLEIVVNFERGYNFEEEPSIEMYHEGGSIPLRNDRKKYSKENTINYTQYKFELGEVKANRKFIVKWIPQ